ncbi:hypothetical protein [Deinococcus ruber]|uniref:Uncharacterized protein n=1 Tax=Deinococcus ruber TaxID=1848197 RepID=A0A918FDS4_9DEIO|nr:hypothetical protein [Deinococcus ruber]GGR30768.1 hypothetical protein GCM10008957_46910 [Deinococcus ruber]
MTNKVVALAASLLAFLEFGGLALWIINTWSPNPQLDVTNALLNMPGVSVFVGTTYHHPLMGVLLILSTSWVVVVAFNSKDNLTEERSDAR